MTNLWVALLERWVALSLILVAGTLWAPAARRCTASSSLCSLTASRTPGSPVMWSARRGWSDWWYKTEASFGWQSHRWYQDKWCHWDPHFSVPGVRQCPTLHLAWSRHGWQNHSWGWGPPLCGRRSRSGTWGCNSAGQRGSSALQWHKLTCRLLGGARRCPLCWRPQRCSRRKPHTRHQHWNRKRVQTHKVSISKHLKGILGMRIRRHKAFHLVFTSILPDNKS